MLTCPPVTPETIEMRAPHSRCAGNFKGCQFPDDFMQLLYEYNLLDFYDQIKPLVFSHS